ncbi:MAG: type II secretion system protein GspG [Selenomonadaceae bacterium]|nr:type II secretion system protein GspG [Selenomonadaceae bacterium]MBR1859498.1 type II secretion system protein GspG [Selenomonadaceae bacterium]
MITVLGILSAVAIPRFTAITTSANTAKVQADLSTIDSAIALYQMDNGKAPSQISDLKDYIQDLDNLKPPSGNVYVNGNETDLSKETYKLTDVTVTGNNSKTSTEKRAAIGSYTSSDITKQSSST